MHVEHYTLTEAFPEKREQLQSLRQQDPAFARIADAYEVMETQISQAEDGFVALAPDTLSTLKRERDTLKHTIARDLKRASGSCCGRCCG
jgi:uncharacterized protein YdcH (DUF465 family)